MATTQTKDGADNAPALKPYSSRKLFGLYGVDLASAAASSACVAPFIAVVDRAIIENANGKRKLGTGLVQGFKAVLTTPHKFIASPQFRYVFGLYFSTYATANVMDTSCEENDVTLAKSSWYKFIATSSVNMTLCILKDRAFARMFAATTVTRGMPKLSYLAFALRDSLTIAASFNAPRYLAAWLDSLDHGWSPNETSVAAQLFCPASVQIISTPLHLLGLDFFNRPNVSPSQRFSLIRAEYFKSTCARIVRIGPAFSIGGVGNAYLRSHRRNFIDT